MDNFTSHEPEKSDDVNDIGDIVKLLIDVDFEDFNLRDKIEEICGGINIGIETICESDISEIDKFISIVSLVNTVNDSLNEKLGNK